MREPNGPVQTLRDETAPPPSGKRVKPTPPPMRVIEKGLFGFRQIAPEPVRKPR